MKSSAALTEREEASQVEIALLNGKASDGSGTEDSGSAAYQFTPSEEWLRELKATQHCGSLPLCGVSSS